MTQRLEDTEIKLSVIPHQSYFRLIAVAYREGGFGVFKPPSPPEILKISVESSIA